ncbi:MAG: tripartite tricarboxylate transporter permease [Hyphomicrobiales bacterium]|nr:tripartite tricarboxylate transporter permease [Hyphomicrobiales bacterium]
MDLEPFHMALKALAIVGDPMRLMYLFAGVMMGLVLGIIPGLGGLVGLSILLPFTFGMDHYSAIAMLLGLSAVTVTSDTIPAVLFSVPGTVGSAATVLDGYPMAQKGEAGRALGAAFSASVIGGVFGALLLGISVPFLRPLVLLVGSAELLAICIFGLSLVASLSGGSPLKGMAAACIGILVATTGEDPQTATMRWTFDSNYLWDGLPIVPFALGLFALPEIADMVIKRATISGNASAGTRYSQITGIRDVFSNWFLVIRCSSIGAILGAIPGMGAAVIDWIAYGHAARTEKGASETFGTGDVRGVIASESSNNAKEGGSLIPTIAFGVPGSASMALLLGAFLIHNIVPGPDLLTKRLDVTYTMVWSVAIANIIGAGICFLFANQLAKIVLIRIGILAPVILAVVYIGVYQASNDWGDIYALLVFGILGWLMKRADWPRPPVILGFVLGGLIERYLVITVQRYDFAWLKFPIVAALLLLTLIGILRPTIAALMASRKRRAEGVRMKLGAMKPEDRGDAVFGLLVVALFAAALVISWTWEFDAKLMPATVAWAGLIFALMHIVGRFVHTTGASLQPAGDHGEASIGSGLQNLPARTVSVRALIFLAWLLFYLGSAALIGLLPAMLIFLVAYMRFDGKESWFMSLAIGLGTSLFCYVLFHRIVGVIWPKSLVGEWWPWLREINALSVF